MRTVVSTEECFHLWANQAQSHARANSVRFDGRDAYSYRALIGRILEPGGTRVYLVSTRQHSVTTSGHQSTLRRSIPSGHLVVHLNDISGTNEELVARQVELIQETLLKAGRARLNKAWHLENAQRQIETLRRFCELAQLPVPELGDVDEENLAAAAEAARAARAELDRKAREAEAARLAVYRAESQERLGQWLRGEAVSAPRLPEDYLRLAGETVETTRHAEVPAAVVYRAAPLVLRLIERAVSTGKRQDVDVSLGYYRLTAVDPNGDVWVGCHRFEASEIKRFAEIITAWGLTRATQAEPSPEIEPGSLAALYCALRDAAGEYDR
jgi:hypothetical protein